MKPDQTNKVHPLGEEPGETGGGALSIIWKTFIGIFTSAPPVTLAQETKSFRDLCRNRKNAIEAIVLHQNCDVSWWNQMWALVGIVLGLAAVVVGFVLWPTENVVLHAGYWYECMLQCGIVWMAFAVAFHLANTSAWMNLDSIWTLRTFLRVYLAGAVAMMVFWCLLYLIWVPLLGLPYPIPFIGLLNYPAALGAIIAAIWFTFPKTWRDDSGFRKRAKYLLLAISYVAFIDLEYWLFSWLFFFISLDYQWVLGPLLPLCRELNGKYLTKICMKMAGKKDESVELVVSNFVIAWHAIFLSVCAGGGAADLTIYIILVIDFAINIHHIYSAFKTKRSFGNANASAEISVQEFKKTVTSIQVMVLSGVLEIILPIAYLLCFLAAYYGPNAGVLGNIKNDFWHFKALDDHWPTTEGLLLLTAFQTITFVLAGIFLYCSVNLNLFFVSLHIMKEYGLILSIHQAFLLEHLFCLITISCAFDFTFRFDWVLDPDNWQNIAATTMMADMTPFTNMTSTTIDNLTSMTNMTYSTDMTGETILSNMTM